MTRKPDTRDRGHGKGTVGRRTKTAADDDIRRQAARETAAADDARQLAATFAVGSVLHRAQLEEADRHDQLAARFLAELDS